MLVSLSLRLRWPGAAARPRGPGPGAPRGADRCCPARPGRSPATTRPRAGGYTRRPRWRWRCVPRHWRPGPPEPPQVGQLGATDGADRIGAIGQRRRIEGHEEREGCHNANILPATPLRARGQRWGGCRRTGASQAHAAVHGLEDPVEARLGGGDPQHGEGGEHVCLGEQHPALAGGVKAPRGEGEGGRDGLVASTTPSCSASG